MEEITEPLIFIDGELYPRSQAKISVYDRGLLYGDGVFEGIRCYDSVVFKLREHIDRLYRSAKAISLEIPMGKEELIDAVIKTVKANSLKDAYIRLIVTRGAGDLGLDPRKSGRPSVVIIAEHLEPLLGSAAREKGVKLIIASVRRDPVYGTSHEVKSLNYLNSILAKLQAIASNADDALMLDSRGYVAEASAANVFAVHGDWVSTPPVTAGILPGITRAFVMEMARSMGIPVAERDITPTEILTADEVFLTGTGAEIVPVVMINGVKIGDGKPGRITLKLIEEFDRRKRMPSEGIKIE